MRKSVALKRFQLQLYRNNWKLMTVLKGQVITNFSFLCMTASSLLPCSYLFKIIFLLVRKKKERSFCFTLETLVLIVHRIIWNCPPCLADICYPARHCWQDNILPKKNKSWKKPRTSYKHRTIAHLNTYIQMYAQLPACRFDAYFLWSIDYTWSFTMSNCKVKREKDTSLACRLCSGAIGVLNY